MLPLPKVPRRTPTVTATVDTAGSVPSALTVILRMIPQAQESWALQETFQWQQAQLLQQKQAQLRMLVDMMRTHCSNSSSCTGSIHPYRSPV